MSDDKLNNIPGVHINSAIGKYEFHGNEIGMPDLCSIYSLPFVKSKKSVSPSNK